MVALYDCLTQKSPVFWSREAAEKGQVDCLVIRPAWA